MNDSYSGQTAIYGGMFGPPSWAQGLALHEWVQVPGNTLASIDPANNPAINPNYPNAAPWRAVGGQGAIIDAWCGACYDDSTGTLMLPLGGGHNDYAGNEPYSINLLSENPTWRMLRNPSGAIGNQIVLDDGRESTGLYADGRLRSAHSYSNQCAGGGRFFVTAIAGGYKSGQIGKAVCYEINPTTGEASLVCDYSSFGLQDLYGAASYDPDRSEIMLAHRQSGRFIRIPLSTGVAVSLGPNSNYFGGYITGDYAKSLDRHLFFGEQSTFTGYSAHRGLALIDPVTGDKTYPYVPDLPSFIRNSAVGMAWQDNQKRLLLWNNTAETNKIVAIKPTNYDNLALAWQMEIITGSGVAPSAAAGNGTFSRLRYSKKLGGLILINATNQPIYFMRTD